MSTTLEQLQDRLTESVGIIDATRQTIVNAAEAMAHTKALAEAALPVSGGSMTGPVSNLVLGDELSEFSYDGHAVNSRWVKDFAPRKGDPIIYVNADHINASDTEGLNEGRGFSKDMPFLTPAAAVTWAINNIAGGIVTIRICSDVDWSGGVIGSPALRLSIVPDVSHLVINTSGLSIQIGIVGFGAFHFKANAESISYFLTCNGQSGSTVLSIHSGAMFTGTVTKGTVTTYACGEIQVGWNNNFEGSEVTGPRFYNEACSRIYSRKKTFPGTTNGTSDSTSVYW